MLRLALFIMVLFVAAIGFAWMADRPGAVVITWPWLGSAVEVSLLAALIALAALVLVLMAIWWVVSALVHSPEMFGRWRQGRRRDKGYQALSRGLVAAGAGNAPLARRLSKESSKLLNHEPLVDMLDAQAALLEGKRDEARSKFEAMLEKPETQLLGLRGLYIEAEKENADEAAAHFASEAHKIAPETPWAAKGLLKAQGKIGDWSKALTTLDAGRSSGQYEKADYNRKRAVILTALAMQEEDQDPEKARSHALAAHKLAPSLVPAATLAARLSARLGDIRKAAKILETAWKQEPHPDLADAYIHLRPGDSTHDRLERARLIASKRPNAVEGRLAVVSAAIDAGEWSEAREALEQVLKSQPSERACLLMADLEEAERGDKGRVREWLSRALTAPRDPVWTADGYVAEEWAPYSPVSGELDAFEWRVPLEQIGGPAQAVDYSQLDSNLGQDEDEIDDGEGTVIELAVAATAASAALDKTKSAAAPEPKDGPDVAATTSTMTKATEKRAAPEKDEPAAAEPAKPAPEAAKSDDGAVEDAIIVEDMPAKTVAAKSDTAEKKVEGETSKSPEAAVGDAGVMREDGSVREEPTPVAASTGRRGRRKSAKETSPFRQSDFDEDRDGLIDRRPDDPGPQPEKKRKRNLFF